MAPTADPSFLARWIVNSAKKEQKYLEGVPNPPTFRTPDRNKPSGLEKKRDGESR